jgi:hypothetical protein
LKVKDNIETNIPTFKSKVDNAITKGYDESASQKLGGEQKHLPYNGS